MVYHYPNFVLSKWFEVNNSGGQNSINKKVSNSYFNSRIVWLIKMCTFTVKKTIDLLAAVANGDDKAEILCLKKLKIKNQQDIKRQCRRSWSTISEYSLNLFYEVRKLVELL